MRYRSRARSSPATTVPGSGSGRRPALAATGTLATATAGSGALGTGIAAALPPVAGTEAFALVVPVGFVGPGVLWETMQPAGTTSWLEG